MPPEVLIQLYQVSTVTISGVKSGYIRCEEWLYQV